MKYKNKTKKQLIKVSKHKNIINNIYRKNIPDKICLNNDFNQWRFNIKLKNRNFVLNKIFEKELFASKHYKSISNIFGEKKCNKTEALSEKILNIFNDLNIDRDYAYRISKLVNQYGRW